MNNIAINPDEHYSKISFDAYQEIQWSIYGPFSGDLLAGLVLGLYVMSEIIERTYRVRLDSGIVVPELEYIIFDEIWNVLEHYIENRTENENIEEFQLSGTFDLFFWWISDPGTNKSFLVNIVTPKFIQGFISIMIAFGVDFRNYVHGLPFKLVHGIKKYYEIQGY